MSNSARKGLPEIIYGGVDPQLTESTIDVLTWFQRYASEIREVPILRTLASGRADTRTWISYIVPRLQDANAQCAASNRMTQFETLLATLAAAAERRGHHLAADALSDNLAEEIGLVRGQIDAKEAHATWRQEFRAKIVEALRARGANSEDFAERPQSDVSQSYHLYLELLIADAKRGDLWEAYGAITMLELCLREEFQCVSEGLKLSFPELSSRDVRYVHHHAGHEERHFDELFQGTVGSLFAQDVRTRIEGIMYMLNGARQLAMHKKAVLESY